MAIAIFDPTNKLFDKQINIGLVYNGGIDTITCASTGPKPQVSIKGNLVLSPVVTELQVRITNFRGSKSLHEYKEIRISAGYANNLKTSITGKIQFAYQETPGPDGVTAFLMFPTLHYNEYMNNIIEHAPYTNVWLHNVLVDVCTAIGSGIELFDPYIKTSTDSKYFFKELNIDKMPVKEALKKLMSMMDITYRLDGSRLLVFDSNGSGIKKTVSVLNTPPRRDAAGWSIVTPFDPGIQPGVELEFDPAYSKTTYGGYLMSTGSTFVVITCEFEFDTVEQQNTERVVMVSKEGFLKERLENE